MLRFIDTSMSVSNLKHPNILSLGICIRHFITNLYIQIHNSLIMQIIHSLTILLSYQKACMQLQNYFECNMAYDMDLLQLHIIYAYAVFCELIQC